MLNKLTYKISIAPMMGYTDRHFRYFIRLISPNAFVYTEMINTNALIYGDRKRFLNFNPEEHPIGIQLGGSNPNELAYCAKLSEDAGFDEVNLNVGCPSSRVQSGQFGACLMLNPELVAECVAAMQKSVNIPISVKCRVGVDNFDSYENLKKFITLVSAAGCSIFIIHARKAWLKGLSPKQNREIPPLQYDLVHQIKKDFPSLTIILNGGIKTITAVSEQLQYVDGIMIGREAYSNPYFLHAIEKQIFKNNNDLLSRFAVIEKLIPYVNFELQQNNKLSRITKHILGLFQGQKGARKWRRFLTENATLNNANSDVLKNALEDLVNIYV